MLPSGQCPRWHISWIIDRRRHIFGSLDRIGCVNDPTVSGDRAVVNDATSAGHRIGSTVPLLRVTGSCMSSLSISTSTERWTALREMLGTGCQAWSFYRQTHFSKIYLEACMSRTGILCRVLPVGTGVFHTYMSPIATCQAPGCRF